MKGTKSLLCGLHKKKLKKSTKPHFGRQWSTYSYVLSGYSLESACARGDLNTVLEILDSMPYTSSKPKLASALSNAAQAGHLEIVKALIDVGADPNEPDQRGLTPLMHASHLGHVGVVKVLLDCDGILIDFELQIMVAGGTALHYACRSGHEDVISALLAAGADPNAHLPGQESPLTLCAQHPQDLLPMIKTLVEMGADVNYCPDHAMPALHRVALRRCPETTIFLLENGANLQHWVSFTGPVLHRIAGDKLSKNQCFCNTQKTIKALIDYDSVELNCPYSGTTPLMCAVRRGNVDCICTLLKLNADPDIKNKQGQTAIQLALSNDIPYKTKIVQILMKAECSLEGAPTTATTYDVFTHDDEIYQEVKAAKSNPRSLKRKCRRVIRRHLGSHLEQKVMSLNLSEELQDFLLLNDVVNVTCICDILEKIEQDLAEAGEPKSKIPVIKINDVLEQIAVEDENNNQKEDQLDNSKYQENLAKATSLGPVNSCAEKNCEKLEVCSSPNKKLPSKGSKTSLKEDGSLDSVPKLKQLAKDAGNKKQNGRLTLNQIDKHHRLFLEKTAQQSKVYAARKKNNPATQSRLVGGLLLSGPNGSFYTNHEVAAGGRPRVASAGMVDMLRVKKPGGKGISKSASTSSKAINSVKTVTFSLPQKNKSENPKNELKTKADKPQKKQDYIVVKF